MKSTYRQPLRALKRKSLCIAVASCFISQHAIATGTIDNIVHGAITMSTTGNVTTIANTPGTIINWHDFSIHSNETVIFNQMNAASTVLNRVTGGDMTQILGTLQSNGKVYLINPAGIAIGQNAIIDVAGFVASTLNITDANFLKGKNTFAADTVNPGSVVNAGKITTPNGGFVYLVAPKIENSGIISAPSGEAILAAGNSVELVDSTDPAQRVKVSATTTDVNLSLLMTQAGGNIFSVFNKGKISANTVQKDATGRIYFKSAGIIQTTSSSEISAHGDAQSDGGKVISFADTGGFYAGSFDVSGKNGGFLETSGHYLDVTGIHLMGKALSSLGKGATWLLDPADLTVDDNNSTEDVTSNGSSPITYTGNAGSTSNVHASTINAQLDSGVSVILDTAAARGSPGNVTVSSTIHQSGTGNNSFTITADGTITFDNGAGINNSNGSGGYNGTLNVTLNSGGRDLQTTIVGVTLNDGSSINTNGTTTININSGNASSSGLSLLAGSAATFINSSDINLNIANGGILLQGGAGTSAFAGISATGTIGISSSGGISVAGGSGTDTYAKIFANGNTSISSSGGISVLGGTGSNAGALIDSENNLQLIFTAANQTLQLTGGSSGDRNSASLRGMGGLTIKGSSDSFNPILNFQAGNGIHNYAGSVGANTVIRASQITLTGGSVSGQADFFDNDTAFIGTPNQDSTYGSITIDVTDGSSAGTLIMNSNSSNGGAKIGNAFGNVDVAINTGALSMGANAGIGASRYITGLTTGTSATANNARVNIQATSGGVSLSGTNASIGSENGDAVIDISGTGNANNTTGVSISNGASIGHTTGTGHVNITGTAYAATGRGMQITGAAINAFDGDISLIATGKGSSGNEDGLLFNSTSSITTHNGNISVNGTSQSTGNNSAGIAMADSASIHSTNGNISIAGTANGTGNSNGILIFGSGAAEISTDTGNISLQGASAVNENIFFANPSLVLHATNGDMSIHALNQEMDISGADILVGHDLTLRSEGGRVWQPTGSITVGNFLSVTATNGINLASSTNTLKHILAQNGGPGGVKLASQNDLEATVTSAAGLIDVTVTNGGNLNVNGSFYTANGDVTVFADGSIIGNSIASIESQSGGTVSLTANNGAIDMSGGAQIVGGTISLEANQTIKANVNSADITAVTNDQAITINSIAAAHNISLITGTDGPGTADIHLNLLNGLASGSNNISLRTLGLSTLKGNLVSSGGATLIDNLDGSLDVLADTINLSAHSAINAANNLEIFANTIDLNSGSFVSTSSGDITIGTTALTMDNSNINASGSIDMIITDSLTMNNNSNIGTSGDININSLPLAFSLASDQATAQKITQFFFTLNKNAVFNINESAIFSGSNLNIAASEITLIGGRLFGGNTTSIFDIKGLTLTGGANFSRIFGGSDTLIVSGGQIKLESGLSRASIEAGSVDSIFLSFPLLPSDGFIVDGVANAITSSTHSSTGFFANGSPAILDENLHVTYGGLGGEVLTFLNHAFNETSKSDSLVLPDTDKNKKAKSQKECGA